MYYLRSFVVVLFYLFFVRWMMRWTSFVHYNFFLRVYILWCDHEEQQVGIRRFRVRIPGGFDLTRWPNGKAPDYGFFFARFAHKRWCSRGVSPATNDGRTTQSSLPILQYWVETCNQLKPLKTDSTDALGSKQLPCYYGNDFYSLDQIGK